MLNFLKSLFFQPKPCYQLIVYDRPEPRVEGCYDTYKQAQDRGLEMDQIFGIRYKRPWHVG